MKKTMIAAMLLAGCFALTGCASQEMQPSFTETQTSPLKIEVIGETEMDFFPGAVMDGKPAVENKGSMDVYCFMTVETPVFPAEAVALEADEPAGDPVPLVRFTISDTWMLVKETEENGIRTGVYAYGTPERLKPGEATDSLFTEWRVTNFRVRNGMCGETAYSEICERAAGFRIQGYAIQADHIGDNPPPEVLWQMIK